MPAQLRVYAPDRPRSSVSRQPEVASLESSKNSYSRWHIITRKFAEAPAHVQAELTDVLESIRKAYLFELQDDSVLARRAYLQAREILIRIPKRPNSMQLQSRMLSFITGQITAVLQENCCLDPIEVSSLIFTTSPGDRN